MAEELNPAKTLREILAQRSAAQGVGEDPELGLFCIQMEGERFAMEASLVHEVVRLPQLTPIPGAPPFLLGVCAHRGDVLPVVDLPRLMGRGESRVANRSRILVVEQDSMRLAFLVDGVEGLSRIPLSMIEAAPVGATHHGAEFLSGVSSDPLGTFSVLDLQRLIEAARARTVAR
jgi:purine-binding chemotaxis protein CheW